MAHHAWNPDCKVYVGGLKEEANRYDLEDAFSKIGKVGTVGRSPGKTSGMQNPQDAKRCSYFLQIILVIYSDVDPDWLYPDPDPDPQSWFNPDPDPDPDPDPGS